MGNKCGENKISLEVVEVFERDDHWPGNEKLVTERMIRIEIIVKYYLPPLSM